MSATVRYWPVIRRSLVSGTPCRLLSTSTSAEKAANMSYAFDTLKVERSHDYVYHVELNRPKQLNAMNSRFWAEIKDCFNRLAEDADCRVVLLSGAGKVFTAGLDFGDLNSLTEIISGDEDIARKAKAVQKLVQNYQASFTAIEKCPKPVVAAVHNACIGGGVDMITACDIRYCTTDAYFVVKEVDVGLAADVGTLQRLPKVIGNDSLVRELCYTCRKLPADEALSAGLISKVFPSKEELMKAAIEIAVTIAEKSPVAVQGTKINLNYSRDHSVDDGLHYMSMWNMTMLQSEDLMKSAMAQLEKSKPTFSKL